MIKFAFVLLASALLIEALPFGPDAFNAAKTAADGQFAQFSKIFNPRSLGDLPAPLVGRVESLKPSDGGKVYGHSVASYKAWKNDNGKVTEEGKGVEVINNNGQVVRREFTP